MLLENVIISVHANFMSVVRGDVVQVMKPMRGRRKQIDLESE